MFWDLWRHEDNEWHVKVVREWCKGERVVWVEHEEGRSATGDNRIEKDFLFKVMQENIFEDIGIEDNNDQGGDNNEDNEQRNHLLV